MSYAHTPALQTTVSMPELGVGAHQRAREYEDTYRKMRTHIVSIPELGVSAHQRAQQRVLFPLQQEVQPVLLQLYAGKKKMDAGESGTEEHYKKLQKNKKITNKELFGS